MGGTEHVIIVSGDASHEAYILEPTADGAYSQRVFHDCKGTVGDIHVAILNSKKHVFVCCYDTDHIAVYSLDDH